MRLNNKQKDKNQENVQETKAYLFILRNPMKKSKLEAKTYNQGMCMVKSEKK